MRQIATILTVVTFALGSFSLSQAAFFSLPPALNWHLGKVGLDAPMLAPIGHSRFCVKYPDDCRSHGLDFRYRNIALTSQRWGELNVVNSEVNRQIVPEITPGNGLTEEWVIAPRRGDCKDYAITKRHQLLGRGWPSRALLLAEVIVPSGEHHLILVVRLAATDLVLDNLTPEIRTAAMTSHQYQWVRIETPQNPKFWARAQVPASTQTAMLAD